MWGELSSECGARCLGASFLWGELSWGELSLGRVVLIPLVLVYSRVESGNIARPLALRTYETANTA